MYAPSNLRAAFKLLLTFDQRLAHIVRHSNEPMIAQMKIAWWHDALAGDPAQRPKAEPTFLALQDLDSSELELAMGRLLDAWGRLLTTDDWNPEILDSFADDRSAAIFGGYACLAGYSDEATDVRDVTVIGKIWALADLRQRFGDRLQYDRTQKLPHLKGRNLRPLSILAHSVVKPSAIGMIWHALTGR